MTKKRMPERSLACRKCEATFVTRSNRTFLCPPCRYGYYDAQIKQWRKDNPDKIRVYSNQSYLRGLARQYGIPFEQLAQNAGLPCEVCGTDDGRLVNDHDHATGKWRGILCHLCNKALGQAKDSPQRLRDLADYLERTTNRMSADDPRETK